MIIKNSLSPIPLVQKVTEQLILPAEAGLTGPREQQDLYESACPQGKIRHYNKTQTFHSKI